MPPLGDEPEEVGDVAEQVLGSPLLLGGQSTSLSLEVSCSLDQSSTCLQGEEIQFRHLGLKTIFGQFGPNLSNYWAKFGPFLGSFKGLCKAWMQELNRINFISGLYCNP